MNWRRSVWLVIGATILFPPAGLILLWLRQGTRWWWKLGFSLPIILLGLFYIPLTFMALINLRLIEPTGGMDGFVWLSGSRSAHYEDLERSRQQKEIPTEEPIESEQEFSTYWTQFRGPNRDGRYEEMPILTDWSEDGPPMLWKQPCGGGYSSFSIANGIAYTIEQRRDQEVAVAYDLLTGREIWTHQWPAQFFESLGGEGPRSTPTWDEGRVYVLGATGELWCFDAETGDIIWNKNIQSDATNFYYGVSGSPLIVDDMLIVQPSGKNIASFQAYDKLTGDLIWSALEEQNEYVSPIIAAIAGQRQIVSYTDQRYVGLAIEDGSLLWQHPLQNHKMLHIAQPLIIDENRIFHSAGYGTGCELFSVKHENGAYQVESIYSNNRMKNKFGSSILHEGFIYGLDESILACLNAETGERAWKGGRYGYGQILFASEHIIVLTERGEIALVKATPEKHEEVALIPAIEGKTWNVPAMSDGYLLVRNAYEMACYDLRIDADEPAM
jgi:outer membrane protein assembly factor BamB